MYPSQLDVYICGQEFQNVVSAVKELALESNSPNLALTLGHYIKQICLLKTSLGIRGGDKRKREEAEDFKQLYEAHWNSKVSSVAHRRMRLRCINKTQEIPSTEDLVNLREYLLKDMAIKMKISKPTYDEYVKMAELIMVRLILFNKRRTAEVDELKVQDFERRMKGTELNDNAEIIASLELAEKTLLQRMHLCEVRGKSTRGLRKVYILMTPDIVAAIEHLLTVRIYAGVDPQNLFVFGRTSSTTPLDACTAMRNITELCPNIRRPDLIRSRLLRKYLATTTQVMDMTSDELKLVADHMGHSLEIHTNIYRLQSSLLERTKVARALLAMEKGELQKFRGKTLDTINLDGIELPLSDSEDDEEMSEELCVENSRVQSDDEKEQDEEEQEASKQKSYSQKKKR